MADRSPPDAALSAVGVVRALWLAQRAGDVDGLLAQVHPDVVWRPMTRPGLTAYYGHAGTRQMLADFAEVLGPFRMDFDAMTEMYDGRVLAVGRLVRYTDHGEEVGAPVEAYFRLSGGLVVEMDSHLAAPPLERNGPGR
jgi:ketosteroid isomerase-like protein